MSAIISSFCLSSFETINICVKGVKCIGLDQPANLLVRNAAPQW